MQLWVFYVTLATHDDLKHGVVAAEWRKIIVAEVNYWEAYKTAIAIAWRTEKQVTGCYRKWD